jgi:hypothetical protein
MAHASVDLARPLRKGADPHGRRFVVQLRNSKPLENPACESKSVFIA